MQVRMVSASGQEIRTTGIVWFEDDRSFIINTKPRRYTFTNVSLKSISEYSGVLVVELQGTTQVVSGTGDVPEIFTITLQHGF